MTRYKLSAKDVAALLASQNGNCAICERELKKFHIDHDHSTSKVRGLLCHRCNILIGGWDDAAWRMRAAAYLGLKQ